MKYKVIASSAGGRKFEYLRGAEVDGSEFIDPLDLVRRKFLEPISEVTEPESPEQVTTPEAIEFSTDDIEPETDETPKIRRRNK